MIKVLLVEDDKNLCFILRSSLEQMIGGYQVMVATNGREGLEALEREAPPRAPFECPLRAGFPF